MNQKELVNSVSRSFALSLLTLPKSERAAVAQTYLVARYADTLVDSGSWSSEERVSHLASWENAILLKNENLWKLKGSLGKFPEKDAAFLVEGTNILKFFNKLPGTQNQFGCEVVKTLIHGMKWDLSTFAAASKSNPTYGVKEPQAFDNYCYLIAGCVGRYWVEIFRLPQNLELLAVSYGKGLQRINILRDVKEDWMRGRVYLPKTLLDSFDLSEGEPWKKNRWNEFCKQYIQETKALLIYGAHFCDSIPKVSMRLRFASMMPLMIGFETLRKLEKARSWEEPTKISRREVKRLAMVAVLKVIFGRGITSWTRRF
ncbi:MAG: Squalene/phytoene synthase [Bacteriovoracaceae bacterium]|nr:Squalene/phytoene synthase [Bacteriovoracaceae bacterium]